MGNLDEDVNNAFGVDVREQNCYVKAIMDICKWKDEKERKEVAALSAKKVCKVKGCSTFVNTRFLMDGVCYRHGEESKKQSKTQLCTSCFEKNRSKRGNLCTSCFKDKATLNPREKCKVCHVRNPVKMGGRCSHCRGSVEYCAENKM